MPFLQYSGIIFSLVCLISVFIYYRFRTWKSSMPTNWPLFGMTPALLWNFHCFNDYITSILKQNGGTFIWKGPWFVNMDILFTSDPANYHYVSTTNFHNYPKGPEFREIFDILGHGIYSCDSELWELHRKTTMLLFNRPGFLNLVEQTTWNHMEENLLPVLDFMSERGSKANLQDIFLRLTFDTIFKLTLDYDPKTLSVDLPFNKFEVAFTKSEEALFVRNVLPRCWWKLLKRFQLGNEKHLRDALKLSDEVAYKLINEKREKQIESYEKGKEEVEDLRLLTGFLREYKYQTGSFDDDHDKFIKDTLLSLVFGGRDGTSSTLTSFFYLVAKNPIAKGKICQEIDTKLGIKEGEKWRKFDVDELEKLAYLQGALCEALRLFPGIPINSKTPMEVDTLPSGHQVRKNTKIFLCSYAMGRMETIWGQDCLEFKPERWISEQGGIKHVPSHIFTVFHAGPRACLGKKISVIQMKIVAATIMYNYNVEVVDGHTITHNTSVVLQMKHGLMVKLTKKK